MINDTYELEITLEEKHVFDQVAQQDRFYHFPLDVQTAFWIDPQHCKKME